MTAPAGPRRALRERIEVLRTQALAQLAALDTLDAGLLAIVAHATATPAALDQCADGGLTAEPAACT